ncbi:MAG: outer membrane beta-barrel protein [Ghiorsea sp.]|nr:outer membrane beta-barrel protein [Ghiorsea sp.]MDQ7059248.1 outer membrane beta-barrel protein [Ghiorsea sp.]
MKKIIAIAALSAALTTSAFAADNTTYVTAGLSSATYTNTGGFPNPGKVDLGVGYSFTPTLAAELSYHQFGDSTLVVVGVGGSASATASVSSVTAAVVGSYPISDQVSLIGKVGVASNKTDLTTNVGTSDSSSKTSLYFAVGGEYNISDKYSIRAQYEDFGDIESATDPASATALGISAVIKF